MRRAAQGLAIVAALVLPLVAIAATRGGEADRPAAVTAAPDFQRDVAPILRAKCTGCHQVGGIAPFSLETAKQARTWASAIRGAVLAGLMPPWPPGPASPTYVGEETRRLSAAEKSTILRWAAAGGKAVGRGAGKNPPTKVDVRPGERVLTLAMPSTYEPSARGGATDDYRCFLLDPKLTDDASATSARIVPGQASIVHHVILYRAPGSAKAEAKRLDASAPGPGWSCFGDSGLDTDTGDSTRGALDDASWIAAWAPGWGSGRLPDGIGVPMPKGSLVVMQVHYNLLNDSKPDRSKAVLTLAPADANLTPLRTALLPAPVELACVKGESGRLCSRSAAIDELARKYGTAAAFTPFGLLLLCKQDAARPKSSKTSVCDRTIEEPATIRLVAGHMHLLGAAIRVTVNPGTKDARILLDIPSWDFHWQNAYALEEPVSLKAGDVIRVTCRFDPAKRAHGGHGIPATPRYVLWGEGTTDEMCLGIVQVTR